MPIIADTALNIYTINLAIDNESKTHFVNMRSASIFPKFDICLKTSVNLPADTVPSSTGECTSSDMSWQNLLGCKQRLAEFL
ncbi:hypothetical protein L208DRAFT_1385120 [Tricholoma matsutake]|nr:hypothetical protein L208DRAFT_1385120 [Tricholoma matsutake 945]